MLDDDRPRFDKPILCLDFDGTLHAYSSGWRGHAIAADPPTPGAMGFLHEALNHFTVFIHSARSATSEGRRCMHAWLLRHYAEHFDLTFDQAAQELRKVHWPITKPHAWVSIDDRAIQFNGKWPSMSELREFRPWNR